MRTKDPDFVVKVKNAFKIQPWIVHPPRCVCRWCANHRTAGTWDEAIPVRIQRASKFPASRTRSAAYALEVKQQEEQKLRDAVTAAELHDRAIGGAVSFGALCEEYRRYQQRRGRRFDRDKYRITAIEKYFGEDTDATAITFSKAEAFMDSLRRDGAAESTVLRYSNVLHAILNHAVKRRLIRAHDLKGTERPVVKTVTKPVTFTSRHVAILLGPALDAYEREQAEWNEGIEQSGKDPDKRQGRVLPLRGFILIAYLTLMRPENNFALTWEQVVLADRRDRGRFRLEHHKNSSKGVEVEGAMHPVLVRYLRSIRPAKATGLIHPNPVTGGAYRNIRKQWARLIQIANDLLPEEEQINGKRVHFYTWRHTGASRLAEHGNPVMIARMMGDTSLTTVLRHYFDSSVEHMQAVLEKWEPVGATADHDLQIN